VRRIEGSWARGGTTSKRNPTSERRKVQGGRGGLNHERRAGGEAFGKEDQDEEKKAR